MDLHAFVVDGGIHSQKEAQSAKAFASNKECLTIPVPKLSTPHRKKTQTSHATTVQTRTHGGSCICIDLHVFAVDGGVHSQKEAQSAKAFASNKECLTTPTPVPKLSNPQVGGRTQALKRTQQIKKRKLEEAAPTYMQGDSLSV